MSYEYEYALGTNGTSNVGQIRRIVLPGAIKAVHSVSPAVPTSTWPTFDGGGSQPVNGGSSAPDDDPGAAPDEPDDFMTTTEEPSAMPWIIGLGAVTALGVGGFFLWRHLSKEEGPGTSVGPSLGPSSNPREYIGQISYKFEGDWGMDDIVREMAEAEGVEMLGSGTCLSSYMRDLDLLFTSKRKAENFVRRAASALRAAGAKRVKHHVDPMEY